MMDAVVTQKIPANRSGEELAMRGLVVAELRKRYPDARIIHELPLRYSTNRIDLAAVRPAEIISVEIKSSKDVTDRLKAQVKAFLPISSRVIIALAPKWNTKLPMAEERRPTGVCWREQFTEAQEIIRDCGGATETWTVDAEAKSVSVTADCYRSTLPNTAELLHILHVAELIDIAARHRISARKRHFDLVRECFELMTGREVMAAVCRAIRARSAFAAESDPPITET